MALKDLINHYDEGGEVEAADQEASTEKQAAAPVATPTKKASKESQAVGALAANPDIASKNDERIRAFYEKQLADVERRNSGFGAQSGLDEVVAKFGAPPSAGGSWATNWQNEQKTNQANQQNALAGLQGLDAQKAALNVRTQFNGLMNQASQLEAAGDKAGAQKLRSQAVSLDPNQYGVLKDAQKLEMAQSTYGKQAQDMGLKPGSPEFNNFVQTSVEYDNAKKRADAIKAEQAGRPAAEGQFDGKTGNYTTIGGTVIKAPEIKEDRATRLKMVDQARAFNKMDDNLIKNAVSSFNVTGSGFTGEIGKTIAGKLSEKTLDAQTQVYTKALDGFMAALPPGPASDKDIQNAKSTFPGFSSEKALRSWLQSLATVINTRAQEMDNKYMSKNWYGASGAPEVPTIRDFTTKEKKGAVMPPPPTEGAAPEPKSEENKPAKPATPSGPLKMPKVGDIQTFPAGQYSYLGGDPKLEASWQKVS